jgi:hypothetical protein
VCVLPRRKLSCQDKSQRLLAAAVQKNLEQ